MWPRRQQFLLYSTHDVTHSLNAGSLQQIYRPDKPTKAVLSHRDEQQLYGRSGEHAKYIRPARH